MRGFVLVNGRIYVSFKPTISVEAAVVVGSRVFHTGNEPMALSMARALNLDVVDLSGRTVLPGFIDAHMHLDSLGACLNSLDLRGVKSIDELKNRLEEYVAECRDPWVLGHGWDQELFEENRYPTRLDLDEAVGDRPVVLTRVCGHAAVLNTKALELTGLLHSSIPEVLKDDSGLPTGVIVEKALETVRSMVEEQTTFEERKKLLMKALRFSASQGVTTVGFVSCSSTSFKALKKLEAGLRNLPVRVRVYLGPEEARVLWNLGLKSGSGSAFLKTNGVKLFADGSLGARTAFLSEPYSDAPETSGYVSTDEDSLRAMVEEACESGMQVAVHAIGDKAVENTLKAFEAVGEDSGRLRFRVDHASVLRRDLIEKMRRLGVVAVVQPHFIVTDWWVVSRVGVERARFTYPFKTLAENVKLGFSTDAPVEPLNPWKTVYAAVTRGRREETPLYKHTMDECLMLEEALHIYTEGSAYALLEENELGALSEGKLADFIIVDEDPFNIPLEEVGRIKLLATYVDGCHVFPGGVNGADD